VPGVLALGLSAGGTRAAGGFAAPATTGLLPKEFATVTP